MGVDEGRGSVLPPGDPKLGTGTSQGDDDWRFKLRQVIADAGTPVHLVGVGNELRTDDAAGLEVVSRLRAKLGAIPAAGVKIHGTSVLPERLLATLSSKPGKVVVFDAVNASIVPGGVVFRPMADTMYGFFGTHNIPFRLVPGVSGRLSDIFLVGVQPASLEVGEGLSDAVRESVKQIVGVVAEGVGERA